MLCAALQDDNTPPGGWCLALPPAGALPPGSEGDLAAFAVPCLLHLDSLDGALMNHDLMHHERSVKRPFVCSKSRPCPGKSLGRVSACGVLKGRMSTAPGSHTPTDVFKALRSYLEHEWRARMDDPTTQARHRDLCNHSGGLQYALVGGTLALERFGVSSAHPPYWFTGFVFGFLLFSVPWPAGLGARALEGGVGGGEPAAAQPAALREHARHAAPHARRQAHGPSAQAGQIARLCFLRCASLAAASLP